MKYLKYLFVAVLLCFLCSCCKEENSIKIELSPHDAALNDLASVIYCDDELTKISQFNGTINELNSKYPIECVRKKGCYYRVSYRGNSCIAVITFDGEGNMLIGKVYSISKLKSDFDDLSKGQTLDSVLAIDPDGEYLFLYTGRNDFPKTSSHYTKDGYLITILYDDDHTISSIIEELI